MKMIINVDEIGVASPCQARWNDMDGDERARFCGQCSKHVFNLSAMTRAEIATLVHEKEGKFCGRFYRRADGTMLTADCPSRLRLVRARLAKVGGALSAFMISFFGCTPRQTNLTEGGGSGQAFMGDVAVAPVVRSTNCAPEIMGKIALPITHQTQPNNAPALMGEMVFQPRTNSVPAPSLKSPAE